MLWKVIAQLGVVLTHLLWFWPPSTGKTQSSTFLLTVAFAVSLFLSLTHTKGVCSLTVPHTHTDATALLLIQSLYSPYLIGHSKPSPATWHHVEQVIKMSNSNTLLLSAELLNNNDAAPSGNTKHFQSNYYTSMPSTDTANLIHISPIFDLEQQKKLEKSLAGREK